MPANSTNTPVDTTTGATDFESSPNPALNGDRSFDTPEGAKAMLADYARRAERIVQDGLETLRAHSRV